MADPAHASQTPGLTIRSLRGDAFTLPAAQVLSRSDFHFAPPRSLRLPIAPMRPPVLQVGLLNSPPQVNSFSFPRSSVPAAQVPRRPRPAPEAVAPETPATAAEPATQATQASQQATPPDAPPKPARIVPPRDVVKLSAQQRETYRRAEEEGVLRLAGMGREATIQNVFELVLRLKQVCNFDTATGDSAKLDCLEAELDEIHSSGKKSLVFSQWVETIGRLKTRLSRFGALEYHGGMSTTARDEAIRQFKHDPAHSVLLLSYGAGAVGLNLQFSQYVFLFDRWWNPAIEDQAINRAHRIGAAGAVTVTRYLSVVTIEERIDEVLRRKRDLSELILSETGSPEASGLTVHDLFALFKLPPPTRAAAA